MLFHKNDQTIFVFYHMHISLCIGIGWISTITRCASSRNDPIHIRGYEDKELYREHDDSDSEHSNAMEGCTGLRERFRQGVDGT